jgi:hypothetical protein
MVERRASPRKRMLKTAHIILSEKAPKIECAVRNVSDMGAMLQISTTYGIPDNFLLRIDGVQRACRVVWRTETKIGVAFD